MKYRHTKRSSVLFILLGIITLDIYQIVVLSHVRKEVNELNANNGVKKQMPCLVAYLLGLITCGIVPLVWMTRLAGKIQIAALERKITSPSISRGFFFCWLVFGSIIIVGPFIAFHRFFKVLNTVESFENAKTDSDGATALIKDEMKEEIDAKTISEPVQIATAQDNAPESPYPSMPSAESKETASAKAQPAPSAKGGSNRPWRVKVNGVTKVFSSHEEAVAYAKKVSAERRALRSRSEKKE